MREYIIFYLDSSNSLTGWRHFDTIKIVVKSENITEFYHELSTSNVTNKNIMKLKTEL